MFKPTRRNQLLMGATYYAIMIANAHAQAPGSIAQPVVPGRLAPNTVAPSNGPIFIPSFAASVPNEFTFTCTASSVAITQLATASLFETIQNPSSNTTSAFVSLNGTAATTGSPSLQIAPGATMNFGPPAGYVATNVQASCSASVLLTVVFQ